MNEELKEELRVSGKDLVETVKKLVQEGNARKIIIKNEKGESVMELPLVVGAAGALITPVLAAVGALAALLTQCAIVVVKKENAGHSDV
jgi:hypothetical protein